MPAHLRNPVGFTTDFDSLTECRHRTSECRSGHADAEVRGFDVAADGDFAARADAAGKHDEIRVLPAGRDSVLAMQFCKIT